MAIKQEKVYEVSYRYLMIIRVEVMLDNF